MMLLVFKKNSYFILRWDVLIVFLFVIFFFFFTWVVDGGTIVIGEIDWASPSSSSSWGWLWRISSLSSLNGSSSSLGKPGSTMNWGSVGQVDEEGCTVWVLKYVWGWSSVASNGCESKKSEALRVGRLNLDSVVNGG